MLNINKIQLEKNLNLGTLKRINAFQIKEIASLHDKYFKSTNDILIDNIEKKLCSLLEDISKIYDKVKTNILTMKLLPDMNDTTYVKIKKETLDLFDNFTKFNVEVSQIEKNNINNLFDNNKNKLFEMYKNITGKLGKLSTNIVNNKNEQIKQNNDPGYIKRFTNWVSSYWWK